MSQSHQPSPTIIDATVAELKRHAPFDDMEAELLRVLAARLQLSYHAKGAVLQAPVHGVVEQLVIVQRGRIVGTNADARAGVPQAVTLVEGEMFPVGALIARRPATLTFVAETDVFCYTLGYADFEDIMDRSRAFRHFATTRLAHLLEQSHRDVQREFSSRVAAEQTLASPLKDLIRRQPVTVSPDASVGEVLHLMHRERIGSVVVMEVASGKPVGIFTERDVLARVALPALPHDAAIAKVMTPGPYSLPGHASVFEAARAMAERRFRHVLVTEEGRLAGVVSERDLFQLQRLSLGEVAKAIEHADDANTLVQAAGDVRLLATSLLGQGVGAEQLTLFVTTMNDALVARALQLVCADESSIPPAVPWCWMGLGSEGRMEQTMATDQDNAIIFDPGDAPLEDVRAGLVETARRVNTLLDQIGFPRCKGDIMAGNPAWCLSVTEWREVFTVWMQKKSPQALLNAAIFFDFRALAGERRLAETLREWLMREAAPQALFLRQMAGNALETRPPLGVLRDFVLDDDDFPGTIDLKKYAARPFVDAARIFALAHGVAATSTVERLRQALPQMRVSEDEQGAYIDAFHFVQLLRLRTAEAARHGDADATDPAARANRVLVDELNELDRRILKEALRQARKLQARLEMDFHA